MLRQTISATLVTAAAFGFTACGSQSVKTNQEDGPLKTETNSAVIRGANLFADRCSGCHTLAVAGTQGSASKIKDRERSDGPDFNSRRETSGDVLYALRNGGFSGAVMPKNLATGKDAQQIAQFLCRYSGLEAPKTASPEKQMSVKERCAQKGPTKP